ncbi:response regulator [Aestuariimicrobium ganziense]|uniref:response regulator n=1 Tax=Aestuariimicrobium ganziense TaxID=2773677 RepID=UPI001940A9AD|nr:response regulator transcription factor [Aestuariimicrobium ganziense]
MSASIRVMVADDSPQVRAALSRFLEARADLELVGEASDGAQAVEVYGSVLPDLVLMDLQMPATSGIEAIERICRRWPDAVVVAFTTFATHDHVVRALRGGAAGYLLKDVGAHGLVEGMHQALAGEMPLSPAVRQRLVASLHGAPAGQGRVHGITPREVEVLQWLAHGLSNAEIGARLNVAEGTVKQHMANVAGKLEARSRTQVLVRAIQLGVVDPENLPALD